jgi:hypothetical protein
LKAENEDVASVWLDFLTKSNNRMSQTAISAKGEKGTDLRHARQAHTKLNPDRNLKAWIEEDMIRIAFQRIDLDGGGTLDLKEFWAAVMKGTGLSVSNRNHAPAC